MPDKDAMNSDGESPAGSENGDEELVNQELENLKEDTQVRKKKTDFVCALRVC